MNCKLYAKFFSHLRLIPMTVNSKNKLFLRKRRVLLPFLQSFYPVKSLLMSHIMTENAETSSEGHNVRRTSTSRKVKTSEHVEAVSWPLKIVINFKSEFRKQLRSTQGNFRYSIYLEFYKIHGASRCSTRFSSGN